MGTGIGINTGGVQVPFRNNTDKSLVRELTEEECMTLGITSLDTTANSKNKKLKVINLPTINDGYTKTMVIDLFKEHKFIVPITASQSSIDGLVETLTDLVATYNSQVMNTSDVDYSDLLPSDFNEFTVSDAKQYLKELNVADDVIGKYATVSKLKSMIIDVVKQNLVAKVKTENSKQPVEIKGEIEIEVKEVVNIDETNYFEPFVTKAELLEFAKSKNISLNKNSNKGVIVKKIANELVEDNTTNELVEDNTTNELVEDNTTTTIEDL